MMELKKDVGVSANDYLLGLQENSFFQLKQ